MSQIINIDYCPLNVPMVLTHAGHCKYIRKKIDIWPILLSLQDFILYVLDCVETNNIVTDKKWDLYEHLGIESFSYIEQSFFTRFLAILATSPKINGKLFDMSSYHFYATMPDQFAYMYMIVNNKKETVYLPLGAEKDGYKIHLMVKPEYAVYAFYKLLHMRNLELSRIRNIFSFQCKLIFQARSNAPTLDDISLLKDSGNGGASPTIVIYSSKNKEDAKEIILFLFKLFDGEFDEIGLMVDVFEKSYLIPTFNIRLNPLMSYTMGNRTEKLDLRIKEDAQGYLDSDRYYSTPKWVKTESDKCAPETKDEINRRAQEWFGKDLCFEDGRPGMNMHFFNYLSVRDEDVLAPDDIYELPPIEPTLGKNSSEYILFNAAGGRKIKKSARKQKRHRKTHKKLKTQ